MLFILPTVAIMLCSGAQIFDVFWIGGAKVNLKVTNLRNCYDSVRSTLSMLLLGGSGGMPPQENFEK